MSDVIEQDEALSRLFDDAALAAVMDDWAGWSAAVAADTDPPFDPDEQLTARELLALAESLPAIERGAVLGRIDLDVLAATDGWAVEEHVRLMATVVAATEALQMRSRLAVAATYTHLQAQAQQVQDDRDKAARAAGERVPPRQRVVNHAVSALMKLENVSRQAAEGRLATARDVTTRLPRTFALLEQGQVSPDHVRMIRTEVGELDTTACSKVEQRIAKDMDRTPGEAAKAARTAAADIDEEAFEKRHRKARHDRTAWAKPLPNGMAMLGIVGPAEHVALRWLEIDEKARALRAAGDPRTLEQLRSDLLLRAPTPSGAVVAGVSRFDPRTGDVTTETWEHAEDDGAAPEPGSGREARTPPPPPPPAPSDPSVRRARSRRAPPRTKRRRFQGRPVTTVLVLELGAYLGATDTPGLIQGVGPIPASVARELAHGSESWFRAVFDDSGVCRDYGRLRMPRQDLRDLTIRAKGVLCACGCGQPAAELDHRIEHQHGGASSEENLQGLAERCSTEKTDAVKTRTGWRPTQLGNGTVRWTSPFGHTRDIRLTDLGLRGRTRTEILYSDGTGTARHRTVAAPSDPGAPPPF